MKNSIKNDDHELLEKETFFSKKVQRRSFLQYAGASAAGIALVAAGCKKDDNNNAGVYFSNDDFGILNYAYALEQLEAAFYTQVMATRYANMSTMEASYLQDIRDHEIAHREFFKTVLGSNAIPGLEVDFSSINFSDRTSVLSTAKTFEDLGVSAYNGAGFLLKDPTYLTLAGKIVSVEARHAALISDLISNGTFAASPPLDANALDTSRLPLDVLNLAAPFIKTKLNITDLPTG